MQKNEMNYHHVVYSSSMVLTNNMYVKILKWESEIVLNATCLNS